jgi:hypothetical protein
MSQVIPISSSGAEQVPAAPPETVRRFWSKVQRTPEACWLWTARVDRGGYGIFSVNREKLVRAHRLSWLLAGNADPGNACLLHRCGNHRCVRPDHLYVGSLHDIKGERKERQPATPRWDMPRRPAPRGEAHWTRRERQRVLRGERSNLAKLTEEDVVAIRRLHASGRHRNADLGAMFGVAERSIYHIVRRKTWTHLP